MKGVVLSVAMREYEWDDRLAMSSGTGWESVHDVLHAVIPGALAARVASSAEDRSGTDHWVLIASGDKLSIDVKMRDLDPVEAWGSDCDDFALELWSMIDEGAIGWTLDDRKRTDYILWWWKPTGRWALVPFVPLRAVFQEHLDEWAERYPHAIQRTRKRSATWRSECVFVPRSVVWKAIYERFGGTRKIVP